MELNFLSEYLNNNSYYLFKHVENTSEIRKKIFSEGLPICLVNPKYIIEPFQIEAAMIKAITRQNEGTMITKSLATELLYSLSPSKNISESLKTFSAQDTHTEFILVADSTTYENILPFIKGQNVPLDNKNEFTDSKLIMKEYKITEKELESSTFLDSIVSRIASKEFIN